MPPTNAEQHILNAAERIEGTVSTIREVMQSYSETLKALKAENDDLRASHPNPPEPVVSAENLDEEFAKLDEALTDMEGAGSSMRAAASAVANSGRTDAQLGIGTTPQGNQGTQGQPPAPASPVPSGDQETGPSGQSLPTSQASDEVAATSDATADTQVAQGGPQESPGVTGGSGGVLIGDTPAPPPDEPQG